MSLIDLNGNKFSKKNKPGEDILNGIIKCQNPECKCLFFQQSFMLKKVTTLENPKLEQDSIGVIPVFICMECGTVLNQSKI